MYRLKCKYIYIVKIIQLSHKCLLQIGEFANRSATEECLLFEASGPTEPLFKKLRSSSSFSASTDSSLFPVKCVFYKEERKDLVDHKSGKRTMLLE